MPILPELHWEAFWIALVCSPFVTGGCLFMVCRMISMFRWDTLEDDPRGTLFVLGSTCLMCGDVPLLLLVTGTPPVESHLGLFASAVTLTLVANLVAAVTGVAVGTMAYRFVNPKSVWWGSTKDSTSR